MTPEEKQAFKDKMKQQRRSKSKEDREAARQGSEQQDR
jgi:hypothetical protein